MRQDIEDLTAIFHAKPRPTDWPERRLRMDEVTTIDPLAPDIAFTPERIGAMDAEWSLAPGSDPTRVLLYLHGGGYCSGSIASHRGMVGEIGRAAGIRTLAIAFRLAPEHPFPAALEDALAAYHCLRQAGIAPERIAIGGDSAGGGLSLATLLSLRQSGEALPAAAWLVSPWVDLGMTGASMGFKADIDPLIHRDYLESLAAAYIGNDSASNPLISPLLADLAGLPPILVQVGSSETLLDDAVRIAGALGAAEVRVDLEIWPLMIHAWHIWQARLPEGKAATRTAGTFLHRRLFGQE